MDEEQMTRADVATIVDTLDAIPEGYLSVAEIRAIVRVANQLLARKAAAADRIEVVVVP